MAWFCGRGGGLGGVRERGELARVAGPELRPAPSCGPHRPGGLQVRL